MKGNESPKVNKLLRDITQALGSVPAVILAAALIVGWALSGPLFAFGSAWQLVINTTTTIITFMMVFIIQHTQNGDNEALHTKIDKILCEMGVEDDEIMALEEQTEAEIRRKKEEVKNA